MLAASADLNSIFGPAIDVDAGVGRHSAAGLARLAVYPGRGPPVRRPAGMVIGLWPQRSLRPSQPEPTPPAGRRGALVVLVNVRVPDSWETLSNRTIDSAAALPGFKVVDWYTASARPRLLWPDQAHPDPAGQQVYAVLVAQAVTTAPSQASTRPGLAHTSPSTAANLLTKPGSTSPAGLR